MFYLQQELINLGVQIDNDTFTYDEKNDCYRCSQGKVLSLIAKNVIKRNKVRRVPVDKQTAAL